MTSLDQLLRIVSSFVMMTLQPQGSDTTWRRWPASKQSVRTESWYAQRRQRSPAAMIIAWAVTTLPLPVMGMNTTREALALVDRTVMQDQGAWVVDYRLRYIGKTGLIVTPDEIMVKVEGWVSNSRLASHAAPRWSSLILPHGPDLATVSEVINARDELYRCRERLVVSLWMEGHGSFRPRPDTWAEARGNAEPLGAAGSAEPMMLLLLSVGPDTIIRVQLRLEHHHILYGEYDPLLAIRAITLTLGPGSIRDLVSLDREQYLAQPRFTWPEPPEERRDPRHAVSGPDSLHLEAHVPGHHSYRFPERPVRYSTKMRLRFWYLIAAGTEGECHVQVAQHKETPISWRTLNSGGFQQRLKTVGRWTKVDRLILTEPEATNLTLEFKITSETEVGEMWIDDVSLEPIGCDTLGGP